MSSFTFATRLRDLRQQKRLTQSQLADLSGVKSQTIAKLEQGRAKPLFETVELLAAALGVECMAFQNDVPVKPKRKPGRYPSGKKKPADVVSDPPAEE